MTQYGYRVFAVELHEGAKRSARKFGAAERAIVDEATGKVTDAAHVVDYRDVLVSDICAHSGTAHSFGISDGEDQETGPAQARGMAIRFVKAERTDDLVTLRFEQGVRNVDGTLLVEGEPDVQLKNKPTLHPYRALLLAGHETTRALLAIEVRGRSCPIDAVVRGLKACSDVPWRLQVLGHLAGEAAMMEFIRNAQIDRVVFDRWSYDNDGQRSRHDVSMAVTADGVDVRSKIVEWAEEFYSRMRGRSPQEIEVSEVDENGRRLTRKELAAARKKAKAERKAAQAAAEVARRQDARIRSHSAAEDLRQDIFVSRTDVVEVDFSDVAVELDDGVHKKKITPTTDFSKFTYVIGRGYVSDDVFFKRAEQTLRSLQPAVDPLPLAED